MHTAQGDRPHAGRWQGKTDAEIIEALEGRLKGMHKERSRLIGVLHRTRIELRDIEARVAQALHEAETRS